MGNRERQQQEADRRASLDRGAMQRLIMQNEQDKINAANEEERARQALRDLERAGKKIGSAERGRLKDAEKNYNELTGRTGKRAR